MSTDRQPDDGAPMRQARETQHDEIGHERPCGQHDRDANSAVVPPRRVAYRRSGQSTDAERRNHCRVVPEVSGTHDSRCERNQGADENRKAEWEQARDHSRLNTHTQIVPETRPVRNGS